MIVQRADPSYANGFAPRDGPSANPNLLDGLVGAWIPAFGPTGGTLFDVSGRGNHGTLTNMDAATDWVMTEKGWALDFDGDNDIINLAIRNGLPPGDNWSVCMALKKRVGSSHAGLWRMSAGSGWVIWTVEETVKFTDPGVKDYGGSYSLQEGQWEYIVCVKEGNSLHTYAKGVWNCSVDVTGLIKGTGDIWVGEFSGYWWNGLIGNMLWYPNRALGANEIQHLYRDPLAPFRRRLYLPISAAGLSIPIAMHHYKQLMGAC